HRADVPLDDRGVARLRARVDAAHPAGDRGDPRRRGESPHRQQARAGGVGREARPAGSRELARGGRRRGRRSGEVGQFYAKGRLVYWKAWAWARVLKFERWRRIPGHFLDPGMLLRGFNSEQRALYDFKRFERRDFMTDVQRMAT